MRKFIILKIIFFLFILCGCSNYSLDILSESDDLDENPQNLTSVNIIQSLRLYLAKGGLSGTDFEQYSLQDETLFYECGSVRLSKNLPNNQDLIHLRKEETEDLIVKGMEVLGRASKSSKLGVEQNGDLKGFADSGQVIINLTSKDNKSLEVRTGFNQVSSPVSSLEQSLHRLSSTLRNIVKENKNDDELCGNQSFYGLD